MATELRGPALAAAVAEEVMGWRTVEGWWSERPSGTFLPSGKYRVCDWRPDLNIEQARMATDTLLQYGWQTMALHPSPLCIYQCRGVDGNCYTAYAETEPLARCLAALEAVRKGKEAT